MLFPCALLAAGRFGVARSCTGIEIARAMTSLLCATCTSSSSSRLPYHHATSTMHTSMLHTSICSTPSSLALWHQSIGLQHLPRPRRTVVCGNGGGSSSAFSGGWYADENRVYQPLRGLSFWTKQQQKEEAPPGDDAGGGTSASPSSSQHYSNGADGDPGGAQQQPESSQGTMYPQPAHVQRELYTVNVGMMLWEGV